MVYLLSVRRMGKKKPKVRWTAVEENFFCSTSCSGDDEDSNVSSANGGHGPNGLNGEHNGHHNGNGEATPHAVASGGDGSQNGSASHGYNKFGSSSSGGRRFHGGRREATGTIRRHSLAFFKFSQFTHRRSCQPSHSDSAQSGDGLLNQMFQVVGLSSMTA